MGLALLAALFGLGVLYVGLRCVRNWNWHRVLDSITRLEFDLGLSEAGRHAERFNAAMAAGRWERAMAAAAMNYSAGVDRAVTESKRWEAS